MANVEYTKKPWGELIYGTKEQIQRLGIAVGLAFPGEEGGPKRLLTATDPRGFRCRVERRDSRIDEDDDELFCVVIPIPGRERPTDKSSTFADGVQVKRHVLFDEYVGAGEALCAAGVVRIDQLPGQPGMNKVCTTFDSDYGIQNDSTRRYCGRVKIYRTSRARYEVHVFVNANEFERREHEFARLQREWEERMCRLPHPAPLGVPCSVPRERLTVQRFRNLRSVGNVVYLPTA